MRTINRIKNTGYTCLISLLIISCQKFVTVDPPVSSLVTASVFNNDAAATAAQIEIYSKMASAGESYHVSQNTGLLGDELTDYSGITPNILFYQNTMDVVTNLGPWQNAYNYIYQANSIIEGLQNVNGVSPAVKQQLTGESKFIRAFWSFYLANCYGDIPIVTTTDYSINNHLVRSSKPQVYQQMVEDLKEAQATLNSGFVDASDTSVYPIATAERVRPTSWAATALLARVYLYLGKYDSAEIEATAVINNTSMFTLLPDLNQVFLKNSFETIWQLATPMPALYNNTYDGGAYILIAAPVDVAASPQLLGSFETDDKRKSNWIGSVVTSSPIDTFYFPYKYKARNGGNVSEYVMVLRLAEQYLIRAESRAQRGVNLNESIDDLNTIRRRAGLSDYSGPSDKDSVLASILHERQVELFTEWGNRWFDLIRTGNINSVMSVVAPVKGSTWATDGHQAFYPIWQSEIGLNSHLTQNAGY